MADKSGVYLPNTEAARAYDEALQQMLESLERRKNPLFDPTLLAIAAGAAKPTQTGGYGEMLGNVAASLSAEQERALKEQQQEAATRLEIASRGMGIEQQKQRYDTFRRMMGMPMEGAAPAAPAAPSGGLPGPQRAERLTESPFLGEGEAEAYPVPPGGAEETPRGGLPTPPGFEGVQGIQIAPPSKSFIDRNTYLANAMMDPSISPAKAMAEAQKLEKERYETREGGVFDVATGMFYQFPKGELVERQIYGEGGGKTFRVDQKTAELLDRYAATNDPRYYEVADRVLYGPKGMRGGAGEPGKRIPSTSESEIEKEAKKTTAQEVAKSSVAKGDQLANRAEMGMQNREAANDLIAYAQSSPRIFGLLQQPGIAGSIKRAAEEGLNTGVFVVRLPASVLETYKLTPDELNALQMASQASAKLQAQFRKMERTPGEGAISDMESRMFAALAPMMNDSAAVIRLKSELLNARADFDEKLYERWVDYSESTGKSYQRFITSPEYKELVGEYRKELQRMRQSNAELFSGRSGGSKKRPIATEAETFAPLNQPGVDQNNRWLK